MPTLTQLEYIVAVDQLRHFGKAARQCHVSQPSLSALIHKLEEELAVTIFDRSQKPVLTTAKGLRIVAQARRVLAEARKLNDASQDHGVLTGELRLGIIPTLAPYLLPLFVTRFSQDYPGVDVRVDEYQTDDAIRHLQQESIDAAIVATPLGEPGLFERPLFYEPFYLFVHAQHPLARVKQVRQGQLSAGGLWLLADGHCLRHQTLEVCSLHASVGVLKNLHFESGNLETLKNLVRTSGGATLLPYLALENLPTDDRRMLKPFAKPAPAREVSLVYHRSQLKEDILKALEQSIRETLPEELPQVAGKSPVIEPK